MDSKKQKLSHHLKQFQFIDSINDWVGSWWFLSFHVVWFAVWGIFKLESHILTLIVSLEAIILMILLLMTQNRQSARDDIRDELDLQADLRSAQLTEEIVKTLRDMQADINSLKNKK
ncbi:MAG: hypothetical protein UR94_C0022G0012 [Parcubacteria group bacterium GW2011_GWA2_36_10]|nr:MAG: hypothetical protein UR94_C0022G0012 [Parcubacteria group bacterium GW2011_GWA2_36_10]